MSEYSVKNNFTIKFAVPKAGSPQRSKRGAEVIVTDTVQYANRDTFLF